MSIYLWTEDKEGKSGFVFWKTFMNELFPKVIVESKNNNHGLLKAVKNIKLDDNFYFIAYDQSFDNNQIVRETKKLMEYAQGKTNVYILNIISFEYLLLEFQCLVDWIFAEEDDFLYKRSHLLDARNALLLAIENSVDYKKIPIIATLFHDIGEYNVEQLVSKLLFLITRNTGFEVSKSNLGICWKCNCCGFSGRQLDDLCGLDEERIDLKEKMKQIFYHTRLHKELQTLILEE